MQFKLLPRLTVLVLLVASLLIAACGGRSDRGAEVAMNQPKASDASASGVNQAGVTVEVTLKEMKVVLDKAQAPAGPITFVVQNNGHIPHDFAIKVNGVKQKTPSLQPGQSASLIVTLAPGAYEYQCDVPGHDMAGMRGTFTVS